MSNNRIESLPKRLGELALVQLNLANNRLGKARYNDWHWIDNPAIRSSLQIIDFSDNQV